MITVPTEPFESFEKIPRLNRDCVVTEKLDGTNSLVFVRALCTSCSHVWVLVEATDNKGNKSVNVGESCCATPTLSPRNEWTVHAGSKNKWLIVADDNYGFARWVEEHEEELKELGPGKHHGEWFGSGIQKRYSAFMKEKRFALFNTGRWTSETPPPKCCTVVPVLYRGPFDTSVINGLREKLRTNGSVMVPGAKGEGVVVFHIAGHLLLKATCEKDDEWKGKNPEG